MRRVPYFASLAVIAVLADTPGRSQVAPVNPPAEAIGTAATDAAAAETANVSAQPPWAAANPDAAATTLPGSRLEQSVANGPNDRLLSIGKIPDVQLQVSEEEAVVTLAVSMDNGGRFDRKGEHILTDSLVIKAFGNIKDGKASIFGLGSFANGAGASIGFIHYITGASAAQLASFPMKHLDAVLKACREDKQVTDKALCQTNNPKNGGIGKMMAHYDPEGFRREIDAIVSKQTYFVGANFLGSITTREYLDRGLFTLEEVNNDGYSSSVFGGVVDTRKMRSLTVFAELNRKFEPNDPVTLCQPIAGTIQSQCQTGADGAPIARTQRLIGLDLRQQFRLGEGLAPVAIAPRLAFDICSNDVSVDIPVYLSTEGPGKLRGGVRGTFANVRQLDGTRKDNFSVGLFLGLPFSLFPATVN